MHLVILAASISSATFLASVIPTAAASLRLGLALLRPQLRAGAAAAAGRGSRGVGAAAGPRGGAAAASGEARRDR